MANNRMWLVNDRLGVRCLAATYYPTPGWTHTPMTALSEAMGSDDDHSEDGPMDWRLVYENDDDLWPAVRTLKNPAERSKT